MKKVDRILYIKLDKLSLYINDRITSRGIAKGLVSIQEDLNRNLLGVEKRTIEALVTENKERQYMNLLKAKQIMKIKKWTDIRFLMMFWGQGQKT